MRTIAIALGLTMMVAASAHELSWKEASGGRIPIGAIAAGYEATKEALFVCRARHANGVHIGKIRSAFGGCNIPYGGAEIVKDKYEVLIIH